MKWLFIIFLLLNICYLGWELDRQARIEVSNPVRSFNVPADVQKLELLKEFENISDLTSITSTANEDENKIEGQEEDTSSNEEELFQQSIASIMDEGDVMIEKKLIDELVTSLPEFSTNHVQEPEKEKMLCVSFGPFAESQQADELGNWLKKNEIQTKQRVKDDKKDQYFWIYLSPSESKIEAMAAIEILKGKGIQDYKLISKGDLQNAISLGLFSTQSAVNRRLNELKNIGYQPIIVPYHKSQSIIWVDAKVENQGNILSEFINGYPSHFNSIPVKCEKLFATQEII